jgi:hypothetical protein
LKGIAVKRKIIWATLGVASFIGVLACSAGGVGGNDAPRNPDTVGSTPATEAPAPALATPVTLTGTGEQVKTVELVDSGYTVTYQGEGFCLIASPVEANGSESISIINDCASEIGGKVSGTSVFNADGPVTLHIHNTDEAWTLTFTPLA